MKKTKILAAALTVAALSLITTAKTNAAWKGWTDYFTQDEGKAIKKMVDSYIRESIEDKDKRWKDIISSSLIKDNGIDSDKIKEGAIDKDKVDDTIAKRKVYTGTIDCSDTEYDKKNGTGNSSEYWKEISVPEIDMDNMPQIIVYNKNTDDTFLDDNLWDFMNHESVRFTDGAVYMLYGFGDPIDCPNNDGSVGTEGYKISVSY